MDAELKECPFCGCMPDVQEIEAHKHNMKLGDFTMPDHPGCFTLECPAPGCCSMIADTKAELVAAWERRAIAQPVAEGSVDSRPPGRYVPVADRDQWRQRAEKAEADLAAERVRVQDYYTRWRCERENPTNTHRLDTWQAACGQARAERDKAEARIKELEAALANAYPNAIDPSDTPC